MPESDPRIYFVSDVHLGLRINDPRERENRFTSFLRNLPAGPDTTLYLLGDIWDFWYEYRDVVPRQAARVVHELMRLTDSGAKVCFCPGNHDLWTFSYLQELGIGEISQPFFFTAPSTDNSSPARFCVGHGDGIGGAKPGYAILKSIFTCRFLQRCFATLHPWLAFRFGQGWSGANRKTHKGYSFKPEKEALYSFALDNSAKADYFIFGHYHDAVDMQLPAGQRFIVLKDWIGGGTPHACFHNGRLTVAE